MHEHHSHTHDHRHHSSGFAGAFWINLIFSFVELFGGIYFGSIAVVSDAIHDFSDSISLALGWYFNRVSKRSVDNSFTFGYRRFSILGAIINGLILLVGSGIVLYHALSGLFHPGNPQALGMIGLAIGGILFNGIAYFQFHGKKGMNEQMVSLHLLEDVLGWVAVLVGGCIHYFFDFPLIDPILAIFITIIISWQAVKRLKKCLILILQGVPSGVDMANLKLKILQLQGIHDVSDIHGWSMDEELAILTIHVIVKNNLDLKEISEIKEEIREIGKQSKFNHITIEVEDFQTAGINENVH